MHDFVKLCRVACFWWQRWSERKALRHWVIMAILLQHFHQHFFSSVYIILIFFLGFFFYYQNAMIYLIRDATHYFSMDHHFSFSWASSLIIFSSVHWYFQDVFPFWSIFSSYFILLVLCSFIFLFICLFVHYFFPVFSMLTKFIVGCFVFQYVFICIYMIISLEDLFLFASSFEVKISLTSGDGFSWFIMLIFREICVYNTVVTLMYCFDLYQYCIVNIFALFFYRSYPS